MQYGLCQIIWHRKCHVNDIPNRIRVRSHQTITTISTTFVCFTAQWLIYKKNTFRSARQPPLLSAVRSNIQRIMRSWAINWQGRRLCAEAKRIMCAWMIVWLVERANANITEILQKMCKFKYIYSVHTGRGGRAWAPPAGLQRTLHAPLVADWRHTVGQQRFPAIRRIW